MQKGTRRKKGPKTMASKNAQDKESIQGASGHAIIATIHCFASGILLIDGMKQSNAFATLYIS
jgi:hypothetical protein